MKKFSLILVLFLSINAFADEGQTPGGGKTCPPQTVCREADGGYIKFFSDLLSDIFG